MRVVMAATVVVALGVVAGAAAASHVKLAVTPSTVSAGAPVRVTGNASPCRAGNTVFAISRAFPGKQFGGEGALSGRVASGGSFSIRGHVRAGLKPGRYAVTARCGGGNLGVTAYVRVR